MNFYKLRFCYVITTSKDPPFIFYEWEEKQIINLKFYFLRFTLLSVSFKRVVKSNGQLLSDVLRVTTISAFYYVGDIFDQNTKEFFSCILMVYWVGKVRISIWVL